MPSLTSEAIILKRVNFGEADRVLTVISDRLGKISVIARGVRKITSRRAGNVEVLNRVKLHLFKGKGYTLTEAESLDTFSKLKENLVLATTAFHIIEIVDRLVVEDQKNYQLYDLILNTLRILERNPRQIIVRAFEVKLLTLLGFWSIEVVKDAPENIKNLLRSLQFYSWQGIEKLEIEAKEAQALENILHKFLERILESKLKSIEVLKKLKI